MADEQKYVPDWLKPFHNYIIATNTAKDQAKAVSSSAPNHSGIESLKPPSNDNAAGVNS